MRPCPACDVDHSDEPLFCLALGAAMGSAYRDIRDVTNLMCASHRKPSRVRLAAQAPDMAKMLLRMAYDWPDGDGLCLECGTSPAQGHGSCCPIGWVLRAAGGAATLGHTVGAIFENRQRDRITVMTGRLPSMSKTTRSVLDCLRGISDDGTLVVQTKAGGGYMILRRRDRGWESIAESGCYAAACALLDEIEIQQIA